MLHPCRLSKKRPRGIWRCDISSPGGIRSQTRLRRSRRPAGMMFTFRTIERMPPSVEFPALAQWVTFFFFARPLVHPGTRVSPSPSPAEHIPRQAASSVSALFPTLLRQFVLKSPTAFHSPPPPENNDAPRVRLSYPHGLNKSGWLICDFPHAKHNT